MAVKRAALYIRVSTDEQARNGYSLGEQRTDLEEYARKKNYAVVDVYADEGISARKTMRHRKELQRLLSDVEKGLIDVIIIKCLDRWFRNVADFYKVKELLEKHSVDWECTQEEYNTTTTQGRLMLNLKLTIAQNESDQLGDRVRYINEGRRRRREFILGSLPIGYSLDENNHLVKNAQSELVKFAFESVAAGKTVRSLIKTLENKFDCLLSHNRIRYMLFNRVYLGEVRGIEDYCEPTVTRELFDRVQEIMSRHARPGASDRVYLFSGLIKCPICGRTLVSHTRTDMPSRPRTYRCARNLQNGKFCRFSGAIWESVIEQWLLDNIRSLIDERMSEIKLTGETDAVNYKAKIAAVKAKLVRLKDLYVDGLIDKNTYKDDFYKLSEEEREYTTLLCRLKTHIPEHVIGVSQMENLRENYADMPDKSRREFWQSLVREISFDYDLTKPRYRRGKGFHIKLTI